MAREYTPPPRLRHCGHHVGKACQPAPSVSGDDISIGIHSLDAKPGNDPFRLAFIEGMARHESCPRVSSRCRMPIPMRT